MSKTLFPILTAQETLPGQQALPLCREVAWDYAADRAVWRGGSPVYVEGLEAVQTWCYNALRTVRYRHVAFSTSYGCELETLVGQPYGEAVKSAEAIRYVQEALLVNPYITAVEQVSVDFSGDTLYISCKVQSFYGEVTMHV